MGVKGLMGVIGLVGLVGLMGIIGRWSFGFIGMMAIGFEENRK